MDIWNISQMNSFCCISHCCHALTLVMLSPHHLHNTSLLFASEWAQELEEKGVHSIIKEDEVWEWSPITGCRGKNTSFHQPWKPRSMKCWAHCTFSAPIFWITYKFWNIQELILTFVIQNGLIIWTVLSSPAKAVFQRRWDHLSSEPGHVSLGLLEEAEALAWSHRRTGSLPAVWARNHFHPYSSWLTKIWVCRI